MSELKIGDVVQLKSGGPTMTVDTLDAQGAHCVWFVGIIREQGTFKPETLAQVPVGAPGGAVRRVPANFSRGW